jgi:hypothetical protein
MVLPGRVVEMVITALLATVVGEALLTSVVHHTEAWQLLMSTTTTLAFVLCAQFSAHVSF